MTKYAPPGTELGARLAPLRNAAGYTQEQLAADLGISCRRPDCIAAEQHRAPQGRPGSRS